MQILNNIELTITASGETPTAEYFSIYISSEDSFLYFKRPNGSSTRLS